MEPVSSVFWFGDSEIPISKQAPEWGRSKATPVGTLLGSTQKFPPAPGLTPPAARTPQTVPMLKTSLVFGFFVCFEFIQSLRNLWFWLEI